LLAFLLAIALVLPAAPAARAQEPVPATSVVSSSQKGLGGLTITPEAEGTRLLLSSPTGASVAETLALAGTTERYQGYDLPLQTVALRVPGPESVQSLQILNVEAVDLPVDSVQPGPPEELALPLLDAAGAAAAGENLAEDEGEVFALAPQPEPVLPVAPVFVLRSGEINGEWVIVLAVTPVYQEAGILRFATRVEAFLPGAQPLGENLVAESAAEAAALTGEASAVAAASPDMVGMCEDNYNLALAADDRERILRVEHPGLQVVPIASLGDSLKEHIAKGGQLSLTLNGNPVAVQVTGESLIFYVESVGDRWNPTDAYVLRRHSNEFPAKPMAAAQVVTALEGSGSPSVVIDRGISRKNVDYSVQFRGFDGDHWSAGDLWINPGATPAASKPLVVALDNPALNTPSNKLPLADGFTTLGFNVSPYAAVNDSPLQYNLAVKIGAYTATVAFPEVVASASTAWPDGLSASTTVAANPASLTLSLSQVATFTAKSGLLIDSVTYSRPVTLTLAGNGAVFEGNADQNEYRWTGVADGNLLYDVTDPNAPIPLIGANANGFTDSRGAAKRYLVTGQGFVHTPAVEMRYVQYYERMQDQGIQAIYITANQDFATSLKPLTDHRCKSYKVAVVDVQAIYNRYSNSQVSADAIRNFLRDAWDSNGVGAKSFNYFTWKPLSVVLVGDATYDPWNYLEKKKSFNLVPPYMYYETHPFIGEAACDNCYGQLNGDDPHTGDATATDPGFFAMEIHVGRIPANTEAEVRDVANKIVRYETQGRDQDAWRGNTLLLADNYWKPDNKGNFYRDAAGDFAATADQLYSIVTAGRGGAMTSRVYFDPAPHLNGPSAMNEWWRSNTRQSLKTDVLGALNSKPALVMYNGHATYYHMGSTESPAGDKTREYVLMMYDALDLKNSAELFLLVSMTCQTSQFTLPTDGGRTIDENFLLSPATGAFATWGSTGFTAVMGHEVLQEGFLRQLLSKSTPQTLGVLLRAGYENVLLNGRNSDDALRTFMLMGDPLTKFRFNGGGANGSQASKLFLPTVTNK